MLTKTSIHIIGSTEQANFSLMQAWPEAPSSPYHSYHCNSQLMGDPTIDTHQVGLYLFKDSHLSLVDY